VAWGAIVYHNIINHAPRGTYDEEYNLRPDADKVSWGKNGICKPWSKIHKNMRIQLAMSIFDFYTSGAWQNVDWLDCRHEQDLVRAVAVAVAPDGTSIAEMKKVVGGVLNLAGGVSDRMQGSNLS
jgi:hypothetical protein